MRTKSQRIPVHGLFGTIGALSLRRILPGSTLNRLCPGHCFHVSRQTEFRSNVAFRRGSSDITSTTVDPDGVALAAIQGLNQKLTEELGHRDTENADLKRRLKKLEALVNPQNGGAK